MRGKDIQCLFEAYNEVVINEDLGLGPNAISDTVPNNSKPTNVKLVKTPDDIVKNMKEEEEGCGCGCEQCNCKSGEETPVAMAKGELFNTAKHAAGLFNLLSTLDNIEPWVASKITKAADYLNSVKQYLEYEKVDDVVSGETEQLPNENVLNKIKVLLNSESKKTLENALYEVIKIYEKD